MRVPRRQHPAAQALQVWVLNDAFHQKLGQAATAMRFQNEYVANIGECGAIGDDARKTDLPLAFIDAEAERVSDGAFDSLAGNAFGPVGRLR